MQQEERGGKGAKSGRRVSIPADNTGRDSSTTGTTGVRISEAQDTASTLAALQEFCARDDGWLRIVPHDNGQVVYFKWKFTRGKWANYYAMWREDELDYRRALWGLSLKLLAIDEGREKPALDHPYG